MNNANTYADIVYNIEPVTPAAISPEIVVVLVSLFIIIVPILFVLLKRLISITFGNVQRRRHKKKNINEELV